MSTQQHNLIGHTFGTYRLDRILGVGGMSTVFLGTKPDGAVAAVKVLFLPWQVTPTEMADFHERFRREAQSLASLNHPIFRVSSDLAQRATMTTWSCNTSMVARFPRGWHAARWRSTR